MKERKVIIGVHSDEEIKEIADDFNNESDRATVILGAAKIDAQLYLLLSKHLRPSTSNADELLDGDSPLGTFSAKINIAYRLGLINAHFAKSLHLIRKIRNSFAHEIKGVSLTTGGHGDRVRELVVHFKDFIEYHEIKEDLFGDKEGLDTDFRMILSLAIIRLDSAIHYAKQSLLNETHFFPPNWNRKIEDEEKNEKKKAKKVKEDKSEN